MNEVMNALDILERWITKAWNLIIVVRKRRRSRFFAVVRRRWVIEIRSSILHLLALWTPFFLVCRHFYTFCNVETFLPPCPLIFIVRFVGFVFWFKSVSVRPTKIALLFSLLTNITYKNIPLFFNNLQNYHL